MKINKWLLAGLVSTAVVGGIAIGVYAAIQFTKDAPTGTFSTGDAPADLLITQYNADGSVNGDGTWLEHEFNGDPDVHGGVTIQNTSAVDSLNIALRVEDVDNTDGKGLAGVIDVGFSLRPVGSVPASCDGLNVADMAALATHPGFGDIADGSQTGDIILAPGETRLICVKAGSGAPPPYNATTSATFRFYADNQ